MISRQLANRIGFVILGLTNNFAYVIMLSAAVDLLKDDIPHDDQTLPPSYNLNDNIIDVANTTANNTTKPIKYCNSHSTSTILLADTLPSLTTKILYPFLLVGLHTSLKASVVALLSAIAFIVTGIFKQKLLIFIGVIFASFSSGLGESTYLSNSPLYGDVALSGWSMGTGLAGVLGAGAYGVLRMFLGVKVIMFIMLIAPVAMVISYFYIIKPTTSSTIGQQVRGYGASSLSTTTSSGREDQRVFGWREKFHLLPSLAPYFLPLLVVYFAEYFINQGIFELLYFSEVKDVVDKDAQYRWFQFSYQVGVFLSRSSLDLFRIKNIWTMSLLQLANSVIFLVHASIYPSVIVPYFYIAIAIIIYEGLLGGFTYVNTFYRVKKEVAPDKQEFCISTVTMADSLGIVMAGLVAIPVHDILCTYYPTYV